MAGELLSGGDRAASGMKPGEDGSDRVFVVKAKFKSAAQSVSGPVCR